MDPVKDISVKQMPTVSVVVLSWNSEEFLSSCIEAVLNQTYPMVELVVMDNHSSDHSVAMVKQQYPQIRIIENGVNLGFAKAHNKGIRETTGKYYLPLNPDVILSATFIDEMVDALEKEDDSVGSASGRVYFSDHQGKGTQVIYTTGHLLTRNRKPSNRGYKQVDNGQYDQQDYIFGVNGACPLFCRVMLEDVAIDGQPFDETFFLYGDDYDLGWRAQLFGWKAIYVPQAVAYHVGKGSGGLNMPHIQFQYARNRYIEIYKNDLWPHFWRDLPYIIFYELFWQVHTLLTNPRRSWSHVQATIAFVRMLPQLHEQRQKVQNRKIVSTAYMRTLFSGFRLR
jgi:GT2 family glycosyltransferase